MESIQDKMLVLGVMSGTSLDGLDLALCQFEQQGDAYMHKILAAKTVDYPAIWRTRLSTVKNAWSEEYFRINAAYGKYVAEEIKVFLKGADVKPAIISSHGHTVFHQPAQGFSTQLGCGATIAGITGITTVCDFRSMDVSLNGQGAPLVPIGDKYLFGMFEGCLNIGGIANISYDDKHGRRHAYDICEANMLLNFLAERAARFYDKGGEMARTGTIDRDLLTRLNSLEYYSKRGAKSIGREWFDQHVKGLLKETMAVNDLLATSTEHIATVIAMEINRLKLKNLLVTGGGAFNSFLVERIRAQTECEIIVPREEVINFKEALIFAFLGFLRMHQKINTLQSVTGASRNSVGGAVYLGSLAE